MKPTAVAGKHRRTLMTGWERVENAIEAHDLTKRFGDVVAVDGVSFEVGKGKVFGFLGPNGAGKTTTIRMLTGVTKPTSGAALISGFNVTSEPIRVKEQIGVVPDNLYDEMSAWDNLIFNAKLHGVPIEQRSSRAKEFLERFGLYDRRKDRVGTFSRGMKSRLMIATALIHEPAILFLDEPTTGLDVQSSRQIRDLVRELNRKGATIFLTTHYIEEADQLCHRVAIINKGKIVAVDTPEKLKATIQVEHTIEISFEHAGEIVGELKRLSNVKQVVTAGDKFRLYVEDPAEALPSIFDFVNKNHLRVVSINTLRPTLEDAFVKLTGLQREVMAIEKEHVKSAGG